MTAEEGEDFASWLKAVLANAQAGEAFLQEARKKAAANNAEIHRLTEIASKHEERQKERMRSLFPEDHDLIHFLENDHVLAPEQARPESPADGIMGPQTRATLVQSKPLCNARVWIHDRHGYTNAWRVCERAVHPPHSPHTVTYQGKTLTWLGGTDATFQETAPGELVHLRTYVQGGVVTHVEGTKQIPAKPDVSKVMVSDTTRRDRLRRDRLRPRRVPLTRETYRAQFSEMRYVVSQGLRAGYRVVVSLAEGGSWEYHRPTRAWAERTGERRLRRELRKLTLLYERDNPTAITAKDLGVLFPMTTEEVTDMLAKSEAEERSRQFQNWDAAFDKGAASNEQDV